MVFGEAMLSMQTAMHKEAILVEAARLLKPGGRYGIHELCLVPDDLEGRSEIGDRSAVVKKHPCRGTATDTRRVVGLA